MAGLGLWSCSIHEFCVLMSGAAKLIPTASTVYHSSSPVGFGCNLKGDNRGCAVCMYGYLHEQGSGGIKLGKEDYLLLKPSVSMIEGHVWAL